MNKLEVKHGDLTLELCVRRCVCSKDLRGRGCGLWLALNVDVVRAGKLKKEDLSGLVDALKSELQEHGLVDEGVVGPFKPDHDDRMAIHYGEPEATFKLGEIVKMIEGMSDEAHWARDGDRWSCGFVIGGFSSNDCYHGSAKKKKVDLLNAVASRS